MVSTDRITVSIHQDRRIILIGPNRRPESALFLLFAGGFLVAMGLMLPKMATDIRGAPTAIFTVCLAAGMLAFSSWTVFDALWDLLGREEIVVRAARLELIDAMWLRRTRSYRLTEVGNVRWTERRIAIRRGYGVQRRILFDVNGSPRSGHMLLSLPEAARVARALDEAIEAMRGSV